LIENQNSIFEIDLEIKNMVTKFAEMDKARDSTKEMKDLLTMGENITNKEMVDIILKNITDLKTSCITAEVFERMTESVDGLRGECNILSDFKDKMTTDFTECDEKVSDWGAKIRDHEDQINLMIKEAPELKKICEGKVGFDMFDEDLDKIKDVFLNNLQVTAEADPAARVASQAFLTIAKRKQNTSGGLSRSDKQKFMEILQKWEVFEDN